MIQLPLSQDETIHLEPYNENWHKIYHHECQLILQLAKENIEDIQHIGSTSVPSLIAKPTIDMQIGVKQLENTSALIKKLESLGYEYLGEAGVTGRIYLRKRQGQNINVHIVSYRDEIWSNNIILRDYLRLHPIDVEAYGKLKQSIISSGVHTLLEYSRLKSSFLNELLQKARREQKLNDSAL